MAAPGNGLASHAMSRYRMGAEESNPPVVKMYAVRTLMEMFHTRLPARLMKKFIDLSSKRGMERCWRSLRKSREPRRSDQVQLITMRETNQRKTSGGLKHCPFSGVTLKKIVIASWGGGDIFRG